MAPVALHSSQPLTSSKDEILATPKGLSQLSTLTTSLQQTEIQIERQRRKESLAAALRIFGKRGYDHYLVRDTVII